MSTKKDQNFNTDAAPEATDNMSCRAGNTLFSHYLATMKRSNGGQRRAGRIVEHQESLLLLLLWREILLLLLLLLRCAG